MPEIFELKREVSPEDIDSLGHVNNQVYLDWLMSAAAAHSESKGWGLKRMLADGEGWVVRRHEIDYLAQVFPGESVVVKTWIESAEKISSVRRYEVVRPADGRTVCRGATVWVWVNYRTGRPCRIPAALPAAFGHPATPAA